MSIPPRTGHDIPEATSTLAKKILPEGNMYMRVRDELGEIFTDEQFATLFAVRGQPALAPGRLALITLFQFAEGLSDRQAAEAVRFRIDWKYALALDWDDPGFNYSVLSEFRNRLIQGNQELVLLDTLLDHFKKHGWVKARGKQRTDSTHIVAAVRAVNRLLLVGETMRVALNALAQVAPEWLRDLAPAEWWLRYSRRFDNIRLPKEPSVRDEQTEQIGVDGLILLEALRQAPQSESLRTLPSAELLRQVWVQQFWTEGQPDGSTRLRLRDRPNQPSGYALIGSPYDSEATFSAAPAGAGGLGYKTHVTETCDADEQTPHLITHVATTAAVQPDNLVPPTIHAALAQKELLPRDHLMDTGYVEANVLLEAERDYGVHVLGPAEQNRTWQALAATGYAQVDFQVDWDAQQVTCPQGQVSKTWRTQITAAGKEMILARFDPALCLACSVRASCTRAKNTPRTISLLPRPLQEVLQKRRVDQETQEFRKQYASRAGIEGTLSQALRVCEMRRSRYIGLLKTHLQMIATAAAIDLYRLYDWLMETPRELTRVSAFAELAPATVKVPKSWRY